jgi:hypothetical protein
MKFTTIIFWYVPIFISPLFTGIDSEVPNNIAIRWECALTGSPARNDLQAASPPGQLGGPNLQAKRMKNDKFGKDWK